MMRHWVNFGLLFSFLALAASGVMAYLLPFSLTTARVHIFAGALTVVLVLLHVLSRLKYFSSKVTGKSASRGMVAAVTLTAVVLLAVAVYDLWPAKQMVGASYEARRRSEIVRSSPLAGFLDVDAQHRFVARQPGEEADVALSLMVRFREGLEKAPAMVVWAETSSGTIIETLYIDEALAYGEDVEWQGVKTPRHKLLPIWRHKHTVVSGVDPHGKVDAFTGATPEHSFTIDQNLKTEDGEGFVLCVEINAVQDPSGPYADPDLGQPSLLYTAYIEPGKGSPWALLELTAHGADAFENGAPAYDLEKIGSAKDLIDLLLVKTAPIPP